MYKWRLSLIFVVLFTTVASAEKIYLKNGRMIEGQVLRQDSRKIVVSVSGIEITYFNDEVERIGDQAVQATPSSTGPELKKIPEPNALPKVSTPETVIKENAQPAAGLSAVQPKSSTKQQLVWRLIELMGTREMMHERFETMLKELPQDQAAQLRGALDIDELLVQLIPVYERHLSEAELRGLIAFYEGPSGQVMMEKMPKILEDSVAVSVDYFRRKFPSAQ